MLSFPTVRCSQDILKLWIIPAQKDWLFMKRISSKATGSVLIVKENLLVCFVCSASCLLVFFRSRYCIQIKAYWALTRILNLADYTQIISFHCIIIKLLPLFVNNRILSPSPRLVWFNFDKSHLGFDILRYFSDLCLLQTQSLLTVSTLSANLAPNSSSFLWNWWHFLHGSLLADILSTCPSLPIMLPFCQLPILIRMGSTM